MPGTQAPITAADLNVLEVVCARLADFADHATTLVEFRPYVFDDEYYDLRDGIIFYRSGYGWRLHTTCVRPWPPSGRRWVRSRSGSRKKCYDHKATPDHG